MIEATYKLTNEQLQKIIQFEKKIDIEFAKYQKEWETLTKEAIIKKSIDTSFIRLVARYLKEELSFNKIIELSTEDNLIENCYKIFKKELENGCYKYDYIMEIDAILERVLKNY